MKLVISQPMFFPWIGFFEQIKLCDIYIHYNDVQYSKGGFTNRVQVKSPDGIRWLTVPLQNLRLGQAIDQVQINNRQDWRKGHYDLLRLCYERAPCYGEMIKVVDAVYSRDWELIDDLSQATLDAICNFFGLSERKVFVNIKELNVDGFGSERVLATALKVSADSYITGHGAINYLDHGMFEKANVRVEYMNYQKTPYPQLYGEFVPYVSILDLIANVGERGRDLINSGTICWKEFVNERK